MLNGWDKSADAWIRCVGSNGDYGREFVLDAPMVDRVRGRGFATALDIGCGEGRFCRMMRRLNVATVGIDPTKRLIDRARLLDPGGKYHVGRAEALDIESESFDAVVSYLSLVDIADIASATKEIVRVLRPGGTLLIANLNSFVTAGMEHGWKHDGSEKVSFGIDNYLQERAGWVAWRGIRILNWHRPLSAYLAILLESGLQLRFFAEPSPTGGDPQKASNYRRVPWFNIMEWQKPSYGNI